MSSMKDPKTPTGELRDVDVQFVSLVSKAANKRKFAIFKSEGYEGTPELEHEETTQAVGFFKMVKDFFAGTGSEKHAIAKAGETVSVQEPASFGAVMDAEEARSQSWRVFDAMSTVFWNITRSDAKNKRQLMEKSLDEFKIKVLELFDKLSAVSVKKSEAGEQIEIEKAGRKIAASRLQALKDARSYLDGVITDAEAQATATEGDGSTPVEKGEDIDMKPEELTNILKSSIADALAPITERLDKIEKGEGDEGQQEQQPTELTPESIAKSVKDAISQAVAPLETRITKMENTRGLSNQDPDGDEYEDEQNDRQRKPVTKSGDDAPDWGGLFTRH